MPGSNRPRGTNAKGETITLDPDGPATACLTCPDGVPTPASSTPPGRFFDDMAAYARSLRERGKAVPDHVTACSWTAGSWPVESAWQAPEARKGSASWAR
ncbi:MAG: hypothetical protein K0R62_2530 [Nonomuraea muscovyensis]|nr:hypothetical protein [Nonomuraea muscovyensis]